MAKPCSRRADRIVRARSLALVAMIAPVAAIRADAGERIYAVELDEVATGEIGRFRWRGDVLEIERATLCAIALPCAGDGDWRPLATIDGIVYTIDETTQTIALSRAPSARPRTQVAFGDDVAPAAIAPLATGMTLDYDAAWLVDDGPDGLAARLTPRAFGRFGVVTHDVLRQPDGDLVRLDTHWRRDFPDAMTQLTVGDAISGGTLWSRPVRFAGVQYRRDFALRPDLVTFPLPALSGEASVPSTLDVFVDGARRATQDVPAGPFEIPRLPVVTGGGEATVVVRDALGREQSYALPFFVSADLLRRGLVAFSYEAGSVRRGYGGSDDTYDGAMASATYRHGLRDDFTLEAHGEADGGFALAGVGAIGAIGVLGTWQGSVQSSTGDACDGHAWQLGATVSRGPWFARGSTRRADDTFCDLAARQGSAVARSLTQLNLGTRTRFGSVNAAVIARDEHDGERQRIVSLNWLGGAGRRTWWSLGVLRSRLDDGDADTIVQASVTIALDDARDTVTVDALAGAAHDARARFVRATPAGPGTGGYVETALDDTDVRAGIDVNLHASALSADAQYGDSDALRLGATGAIGRVGGTTIASRRLGDAFAVIDTGGVAGVTVLRENQPVGRTNADGRVVVTELRPFERNRIALDPLTLPPEARAGALAATVVPSRGGGVVARIDAAPDDGGEARIRLADGSDAPFGSVLTRDGVPVHRVGYDGIVDARWLAAGATLALRGAFGTCTPRPDPARSRRLRPAYVCEVSP